MKNTRKMTIVIGLVALVALAFAACSPATAPAADNQVRNVISVNGEGEAIGTPDVAYVQLGIETSGGDLDEAIAEANRTMARIQAAVMSEGVADEDMQTTGFNVFTRQPRDDFGQPSGQPVYQVSNQLRVTVRDISNVGAVIGAGLEDGANEVHGLSFGIEDTSALEEEARQAAVADARARAESLASGLNVTVGDPVFIGEAFGGGGPIVARAMMAEAAAFDAAPPISEGQLSVFVSVQVEFEIESK